jgi:hypothetical protein
MSNKILVRRIFPIRRKYIVPSPRAPPASNPIVKPVHCPLTVLHLLSLAVGLL